MVLLFLALAFAAPNGSKLTPARGWDLASTVPSDYARQAAAADGESVFAVSNTHVARYDRVTGKFRIAATAADTKHLNSAFAWKGKIYCAHSNYPAKPETSDIRVYDPSTDKLEILRAFEKPPGSLVWCVREPADKFWWCCFAHYGADNAKTLLVKMDDRFQELDRWTFPKIAVDDWDGMSASGGLWDDDSLLVSHHHFPVLYRLQLPKSGKELAFVEALSCPFPGQGIAVDPKVPGGLVGIDREKKTIVFGRSVK